MTAQIDIEDAAALRRYLADTGRVGSDEAIGIRKLCGGVSNRTVKVTRDSGESWVLKQALPKLRVEADWFCPPERISREALAIDWLSRILPRGAVPSLVFLDASVHLLAMTAAPEQSVNWKSELLAGRVDASVIEQFARVLAAIHSCPVAEVPREFADRSFFEALRLEPYYEYAAGAAPEAASFLRELVAETRATAAALVHGDYSPKNVLVHDGRLILLDHEVMHIGDPAFDLGFSLTHLLSKAHHLPAHRARFSEAALAYWRCYSASAPGAAGIEARAVRHTLGCLIARVAGRSPLEYLAADERARQLRTAVAMAARPPDRAADLIAEFRWRIEEWR